MAVADHDHSMPDYLAPPPLPGRRAASGALAGALKQLLGWLLLVGILVGAVLGAAYYAGVFTKGETADRLTHKVARGDLVITVVEDGSLESAANTEIRCQVAGGAIIKSIIPDGTVVKEDDQLVELDSSTIDDQILTQQIAYEKARAVRDQAVNDLAAAKITLREYVEGTFKKDLQLVDSQITVAEENLRSSKNTLQYTERMFRKAYVTPLQLEAQQFAVRRAELDLETAKTAKKVLEEFTFEKMKNGFETMVATAEAKAKSEQAAFELEESKLKRLQTQKLNTVVKAPQAGMVVYANDSGGGFFGSSDRPKIEEGATVREGQIILRLPDLSQMQVKVTVHESKVESLQRGMRASVRIQNRKLTGYVISIANQPESSSRYSSGVKEYATIVRIDGEQSDLKPGMTAEVDILVDERNNVLTVPVQCVVEQANRFYVWKVDSAGAALKTEVKIAPGDERSVEIRQGLVEGDFVLQSPPEKSEGSFGADGGKNFGAGPTGTGPRGTGPRDAGPRGTAAMPGTGDTAGPGAPGNGTRSGGPRPDIMANDKDGDGKLSRAEAPERMQAFFDRMDADGDGFITRAEATAAAERMRAAGGAPPGSPASAGPDADNPPAGGTTSGATGGGAAGGGGGP